MDSHQPNSIVQLRHDPFPIKMKSSTRNLLATATVTQLEVKSIAQWLHSNAAGLGYQNGNVIVISLLSSFVE